MLAPIAWRTPPRHYGSWELVTSRGARPSPDPVRRGPHGRGIPQRLRPAADDVIATEPRGSSRRAVRRSMPTVELIVDEPPGYHPSNPGCRACCAVDSAPGWTRRPDRGCGPRGAARRSHLRCADRALECRCRYRRGTTPRPFAPRFATDRQRSSRTRGHTRRRAPRPRSVAGIRVEPAGFGAPSAGLPVAGSLAPRTPLSAVLDSGSAVMPVLIAVLATTRH